MHFTAVPLTLVVSCCCFAPPTNHNSKKIFEDSCQAQSILKTESCIPVINIDMENFLPAVQIGDCRTVVDCLYDGAKSVVNAVDSRGCLPLYYAIENCDGPMVKLLLNYGADLDAYVSDSGETALGVAATKGSVQVARLLLEAGADPEVGDSEGWSALHIACFWGNLDVAKLIVSFGANVNALSPSGQSPLHLAVTVQSASLALPLVHWLILEQGANVLEKDASGRTPLHHACLTQPLIDLESIVEGGTVVKVLLKYYPELRDMVDIHGRTALHYAVVNNFVAVVSLVENRAAIEVKDKSLMTPLHRACRSKWSQYAAEYLLSKLLQNDTQKTLHEADSFGNTPLHYASRSGYYALVRKLLNCGARVNVRNIKGQTPLHLCRVGTVSTSIPETVKKPTTTILTTCPIDEGLKSELTMSEIKVQEPDQVEDTIDLANQESIAELLLDSGASATATDRNECLPFFYQARIGGCTSEAFVLVRAAATLGLFESRCLRKKRVSLPMDASNPQKKARISKQT